MPCHNKNSTRTIHCYINSCTVSFLLVSHGFCTFCKSCSFDQKTLEGSHTTLSQPIFPSHTHANACLTNIAGQQFLIKDARAWVSGVAVEPVEIPLVLHQGSGQGPIYYQPASVQPSSCSTDLADKVFVAPAGITWLGQHIQRKHHGMLLLKGQQPKQR